GCAQHCDMLLYTGLKANETGACPWRSMDTHAFPPPIKIAPCRNTHSALRAHEQPITPQSATGKAFLDMLGVFAEFETNLRRERQLEGIAAAKARGVYRGRKPSIDPVAIHRLHTEERLGASAIARRLGIGRASVYRALA